MSKRTELSRGGVREGAVFLASIPRGADGRLIDGWRRVVGVDQPRGYIAFVGQRSDRVRFVKSESFARWVRRRCQP